MCRRMCCHIIRMIRCLLRVIIRPGVCVRRFIIRIILIIICISSVWLFKL